MLWLQKCGKEVFYEHKDNGSNLKFKKENSDLTSNAHQTYSLMVTGLQDIKVAPFSIEIERTLYIQWTKCSENNRPWDRKRDSDILGVNIALSKRNSNNNKKQINKHTKSTTTMVWQSWLSILQDLEEHKTVSGSQPF